MTDTLVGDEYGEWEDAMDNTDSLAPREEVCRQTHRVELPNGWIYRTVILHFDALDRCVGSSVAMAFAPKQPEET